MSSSEKPGVQPAEESDRDYFLRLEDLFIGLRGAPLLLSPSDWEIARTWRKSGVPFDLIETVLREIFDRTPEKRGRSGVRSLKYFDNAVQSAWADIRSLGTVSGNRDAAPLDVSARLEALAAALPGSPAEVQSFRSRILELRTKQDPEEVEGHLAALDLELIRTARETLGVSEIREIEDHVAAASARMEGRLEAPEAIAFRSQLEVRHLRSLLHLPLLSLFSPAADRPPVSD